MEDRILSGITDQELRAWGGDEVFNRALSLCQNGDVIFAEYDDDRLEVRGQLMHPGGWPCDVSFRLKEKGRIEPHCFCERGQRYAMVCEHVVAIGIKLWSDEGAILAEREQQAKADEEPEAEQEGDWIEVPLKPKFYAYVMGSRASLSIEVNANYFMDVKGEIIDFPACSLQPERTVYLRDPSDELVRRTRSMTTEREAMTTLERDWGFERGYREGDLKLYLTDSPKVLNFLGAGIPEFRRRGWMIEQDPRLEQLVDSMPRIVPEVKIADAPGGAFDVCYDFAAIGEGVNEKIDQAEIAAAVHRGDGYVHHGDRFFLLDNAAIDRMHGVFKDCATTQGGAPTGWFRVRGVHAPYVKGALESLDIELETAKAEQWLARASSLGGINEQAKFEPVALGPLEGVLRPYQKQGVYWMSFLQESGYCGLLADEMGLGKTLQTLTWLSLFVTRSVSQMDADAKPALIVCPTSLVQNWEAEAKKFTPWLKTLVVSGPDRARSFGHFGDYELIITSYNLLQRDFEAAYLEPEFAAVVLDEAQRIKNRDTKNARAVKLIKAYRRLALTGTPVENSVADVWSIFNFLMPDYLGEYEQFRMDYELPISEGGAEGENAASRLKARLAPFILRRLKMTVAKDLPDKIIKVSLCPMAEEDQREYNEALAKTRLSASGAIKAKGFAKSKFEILAMLMKLRQISSRAKLGAFMEQLESAIEGGHKILVFSQFVTMLKTIGEELSAAGVPFCYLDGSTKNRLEECNRFNRDPKIPVFLISLMAGGTGLNLTSADMVIHYDPWWNPAVEDQATDRAHRIGQKRSVYVIKMIAAGSIEEKVLAMQRRKQAVIAATVSTTDEAVMSRLSATDIAELLS